MTKGNIFIELFNSIRLLQRKQDRNIVVKIYNEEIHSTPLTEDTLMLSLLINALILHIPKTNKF